MTSIGIIGAGAIAKEHAKAAVELGTDVRYIVDVDLERATELAETCSAKPITDVQQMFSDDSVGGVVIGIPNVFHHPMAVQCLEAGKDILLEKPMGLNSAECKEINATAAANDRLVQVGLVNRYSTVGYPAKTIRRGRPFR